MLKEMWRCLSCQSSGSYTPTLKKDVIILRAIVGSVPTGSTGELNRKHIDISTRIHSLWRDLYLLDSDILYPKGRQRNRLTHRMSEDLRDAKASVKELLSIYLEREYESDDWRIEEDGIRRFVDDMLKVLQGLDSFVLNLTSYIDLSIHLARACESKMDNEIWKRARVVADHTAMFFYSYFCEPDTDYDLELSHLVQMTDPSYPDTGAFYLKIFNSLGLSDQIPSPDIDEMNFMDYLLLYLANQITHYEECQAGFFVDKLIAYETLVKASVSYSPLSLQYISTKSKINLYMGILKHVTAVLSFSPSKDFKAVLAEESMDASFNQFVDKLVQSGFVKDLVDYNNRSFYDQLEEFSSYLDHVKALVSYPPLRYLCSNIIFQKIIVKVVTIVPSLPSKPTCCPFWRAVFFGLSNLGHLGNGDLIRKYNQFMEIKKFHSQEVNTGYEVSGRQAIGQYIDGLEKVQKQYLGSNEQAIISIQNLRSFQNLRKTILSWYKNQSLLNDLKSQLLLVIEHTAILLCSCWLEPEKNQELKLTQLLRMTTIKNAKVHSIYVQGFKTLTQSVYSPWPNELAEASFIDHMLLYLKELIECQSRSLSASLKEQLENLHRHLTVLRNMVAITDIEPSSQVQLMPRRMERLHSLVIKLVMTIATFSITDSEDAEKKNLALLHDLEVNITLLKTELQKAIPFDYPSVVGEFFPIFKNLKDLLTLRTDLISPMKPALETVYTEMVKLRSFVERAEDKRIENKDHVKDLQQSIIQVSHKADFIIQSYVNRDGPTYYNALQLSFIKEDIQHLITKIKDHDTNNGSYGTAEETAKEGYSEGTTSTITDMMVGFDDEFQAILKRLTENSRNRNIVAIVGMPGLGKTTIAKRVYNHPSALKFHLRAWCCVSQSYQKKELLLQILRSITEVNDDLILKESDDEIAAMLFKCLKKRRYLIVLDDVWETKAWEDLVKSFPDDSNQSRVIITSRNDDVAQILIQATPHSNVHSLREFHDSESYKLLQHQLFPKDRFPLELSDAGMMIAKKCRGLPLAVVLAAGILSRMEKTEDHWINFGESLSTQIVNEAGNQCKALIDLSYTHLPDHLKSCFLYFGIFPEDKEISARKLACLWIAEGFVRDANQERLEDVAEHYLNDLIGRSLVSGTKSVSRPGIKSCHVHDLVRDFCLAKAKEEKFLEVVRGYKKYLPPKTNHFDKGADPNVPHDRSNITHLQYRLSIYSKRKHFIKAEPSGQNVRSLFFHALVDMNPNRPYDTSFISRYFQLIKVLDLESINIGDSLTGVALMLHLRYLAVKGDVESVPTTIENLRSLETFILRGLRDAVISVPNSIWRLLRLRHLHIDDRISVNLDSEGTTNSGILADMESFSTPTISYGDDMEKLLQRLPNLRKLKCIFLDSWNNSEKCNRFPLLEFLTHLLSLKVSWNYKSFRSSLWPCRFSFPSNLTKLTLSKFGLPWSEISAIGKLPSLISLKLLSKAFSGKRWDMREGEFSALKYLKLESLDVKVWSATDEHIPNLERLVLSKCERLKEIPSEFAYINTLEIIELLWCNGSAANSARSIRETAKEEYGDYTITALIYPNEEIPGASS